MRFRERGRFEVEIGCLKKGVRVDYETAKQRTKVDGPLSSVHR
jgi:hypothetical protein